MSAKWLAHDAVRDLKATRGQAKPPSETGSAASVDNALMALLTYIPTEATAIYLATVSALPAIQGSLTWLKSEWVYWAFVVIINPALFVLFYYNQLARNGEQFPKAAEFPWWRLSASVVAFAVWALCVPNNPYAPADKPGRLVWCTCRSSLGRSAFDSDDSGEKEEIGSRVALKLKGCRNTKTAAKPKCRKWAKREV